MSRTSRLLRLAQKAAQANSRSISTNGKGLGASVQQAGGATNPGGATPTQPSSFQQTRGAVRFQAAVMRWLYDQAYSRRS